MFRFIVLLCFSIAAVVSCSSPGVQESLEQQGSVAPSDPMVEIDFPVDRQVDEWVPANLVKGSDYRHKNDASYVVEWRNGLRLLSEETGICYAIYELRPDDALVDHLVIREYRSWFGFQEPYVMVFNHTSKTWDFFEPERDPADVEFMLVRTEDWQDYQSPAGSINVGVVHLIPPGHAGVYVNIIEYVTFVSVEEQARCCLQRIIEAEAVFHFNSSPEPSLRRYADLWRLFGGEIVPELQDDSLKHHDQPHGIKLLVIDPMYFTYSAIAAFPKVDGSWGVWIRDTESTVRLESSESYREVIAVETLKHLRRAQDSHHQFYARYGDLMALRSPLIHRPFIGYVLASSSIGHDVAAVVTQADTEEYSAKAWTTLDWTDGEESFTYEMHEDGVIVKVE